MSSSSASQPSAKAHHYLTLGVVAFAKAEDVKTAYRKLARKYHPDSPTGDEERFKAINDAYAVLNDSAKKLIYDAQLRQVLVTPKAKSPTSNANGNPRQPEPKTAAKPSPQKATTPPPDEDIHTAEGFFERFLKEPLRKGAPHQWPGIGRWFDGENATEASQPPPHRGEDVSVNVSLALAEATKGTTKTVHIKHKEQCPACHGAGVFNDQRCRRCRGEKTLVTTRKIEVTIPAGVQHGAKIRVAGEGGRGATPAHNGDLYLLVQLKSEPGSTESHASEPDKQPNASKSPPNDQTYTATGKAKSADAQTKKASSSADTIEGLRIEGNQVHSEAMVPFWDALLGGQVTVITLHGPVVLTIPPNTTSGKVLRLKGQGVKDPSVKAPNGIAGDHWVRIMVDLPTNLTDAQRQQLTAWRPL